MTVRTHSRRLCVAVLALSATVSIVAPAPVSAGRPGGGGGGATVRKIMPLGDSITAGQTSHATYRRWLVGTMTGASCAVDMVGSKTGWTGKVKFDAHHEGYIGWTADQVLATNGWNTYVPDVVLVHLGTNDMIANQDVASTISELSQIVRKIQRANPNATVALAQIIGAVRTGDPTLGDRISALNAQIAGLGTLSTTTSPVVVVDQHTGFDPSTDTYDGIHPNDGGEQKMAAKWWAALGSACP